MHGQYARIGGPEASEPRSTFADRLKIGGRRLAKRRAARQDEWRKPADEQAIRPTFPRAATAGATWPRVPEVAAFLARAAAHRPPPPGGGRLIFALDATMSRQPTWDLACQLQAAMFDAAARAGGLEVQLVYFRGHGEARASRWVADAAALKRLMTGIACHGGLTQIGARARARRARRREGAGRGAGLRRRRDGGERRPALRPGRRARRCATPAPSCSTRARDPAAARRLPRDRPADRRRLPAVRRPRRGRARARCSARSAPTPPAAGRRSRRPAPARRGGCSPTSRP